MLQRCCGTTLPLHRTFTGEAAAHQSLQWVVETAASLLGIDPLLYYAVLGGKAHHPKKTLAGCLTDRTLQDEPALVFGRGGTGGAPEVDREVTIDDLGSTMGEPLLTNSVTLVQTNAASSGPSDSVDSRKACIVPRCHRPPEG